MTRLPLPAAGQEHRRVQHLYCWITTHHRIDPRLAFCRCGRMTSLAPTTRQEIQPPPSRCPRCGSGLNQNRHYPGEGNRYYCPPCDVEWWTNEPAAGQEQNT